MIVVFSVLSKHLLNMMAVKPRTGIQRQKISRETRLLLQGIEDSPVVDHGPGRDGSKHRRHGPFSDAGQRGDKKKGRGT